MKAKDRRRIERQAEDMRKEMGPKLDFGKLYSASDVFRDAVDKAAAEALRQASRNATQQSGGDRD